MLCGVCERSHVERELSAVRRRNGQAFPDNVGHSESGL